MRHCQHVINSGYYILQGILITRTSSKCGATTCTDSLSFNFLREYNQNGDLTNKPAQVNENVIIVQNVLIYTSTNI